MTQDEIIEMAREAGIIHPQMVVTHLEAFAKLVAAKATEEANARSNASWTLMCEKMVAFEREACAKVCEYNFSDGALIIAEAIRARGNA